MTAPIPPLPYASAAEPLTVNQDVEHLRLLAIFHWIVGGFQCLFGCFPIMYIVMGILFLNGTMASQNGSQPPPPEFLGWFFIILGVGLTAVLWIIGLLTLYSGFQLHRRRRRLFSLVIAGINCLHFPFGTALGVFTLIVLCRRSVEMMYRSTART